MSGPVIPYTPAASTAWGQAFAAHAVTFNDPVDTAYPSADPDRVDAQFFLNQVQCEILRLQQIAFAGGGAIQVRNASGSTLNNGPVRVTGYYQDDSSSTGTGNPIFTIVAADAATNTYANALLLTSLANATTGVAYVMGDFTPSPGLDLSGGSVGDPVYLAAGGGMTRAAPSGADQMVQVIGQIKTNAVTGVVAGFVQGPKKFGTSWVQNKAITAALVASGAASSGQALIADGSGGAAFSGTVSVPSGGTGAATLGTSKQPLLGNGTGAVTASAAPTTTDANADAIAGTSATTKKALVLQGKASQTANIFEIQNSAGATVFAISLGSATVSGPNNTNLGANAGTALTLGSNNTNVGVNAGSPNTSGSRNTCLGSLAGGTTQATGSDNTLVGENTDTNASTDNNATVIGSNAKGADSSTIVGKGVSSSTANDLIVRSGDTGVARKAAGRLQATDGSGNSVGDIVPNARAINYMINGAFDVNQRVPDTSTTISGIALGTDKYSADRWKVSAANADVQFARTDTSGGFETGLGARYYGTYKKITNAGKLMVYQVLESRNGIPLAGRPLTIQAKIKSSANATFRMALIQITTGADAAITTLVPTTWGTASTDPTLQTNYTYVTCSRIPSGLSGSIVNNEINCVTSGGWTNFGGVFTPSAGPSNCKNLIVAIWSDSNMAVNDTVSISEVGLYDGAGVRDWVPTLYQEELARCQRYFWTPTATGSFLPNFGAGVTTAANSANINVSFPVAMRILPNMGVTASQWLVGDGVTNAACTALAISGFSGPCAVITATSAGGAAAGRGCQLVGDVTGSRVITFDSDF